jgi:GNAT superfamily N-acetyltransferase
MKDLIQILPATEAQLELIQELAYAIWPSYYQNIISLDQIEYMLRELYSEEALLQQMKGGQSFYLGWKGKQAIGFIGLTRKNESDLKLDKLYLLDEFRGTGFGKKMMEKAEELTLSSQCRYLILNVNRFNKSLGFYQKAGFLVREEVDIPFGPFWLNDFVMEKEVR